MGYTRGDIVDEAFAEIGVGTVAFDVPAEMLEAAGRKLDRMMADWNARGIRLGYPLPMSPGAPELSDETNLPDRAFEAVVTNLALRIAPLIGRQPSAETRQAAKYGYTTIAGIAATPQPIQMQRMPAGAGNKPWRFSDPFLPAPNRCIDPLWPEGEPC